MSFRKVGQAKFLCLFDYFLTKVFGLAFWGFLVLMASSSTEN